MTGKQAEQIMDIVDDFNFNLLKNLLIVKGKKVKLEELRESAYNTLKNAIDKNVEVLFSGYFMVLNTENTLELHASLLNSRIDKTEKKTITEQEFYIIVV